MKSKFSGIGRLAAGVSAAVLATGVAFQVRAADLIGQPTDGAVDMQPGVTDLRHQAMAFNNLLLVVIIGICVLVLGLLLWCTVRYNAKANPTPARWSHNTLVEVTWTIVPVLILMVIAIFSFRLLFNYHDMPRPYMTVKATGYQWYWGYAYPDQNIAEQTSAILPEDIAKSRGVPFRLASTQPIVVPVNQVVRVLTTGADVIHSFSVPAFGIKIDAIPGRVNQTWFKAERIGTYYGQCSQLCGIDHAFMPIEVKVVSQADFNAWVATKQPPPAAAAPAATPAAAPAAPAAATNAAPASAPAPAPAAANAAAPAA